MDEVIGKDNVVEWKAEFDKEMEKRAGWKNFTKEMRLSDEEWVNDYAELTPKEAVEEEISAMHDSM